MKEIFINLQNGKFSCKLLFPAHRAVSFLCGSNRVKLYYCHVTGDCSGVDEARLANACHINSV